MLDLSLLIQAISAIATAMAALFALQSARASSKAAKEAALSRRQASMPALVVETQAAYTYAQIDMTNQQVSGFGFIQGQGNSPLGFQLENLGNGPALNVFVECTLMPTNAGFDVETAIAKESQDGRQPWARAELFAQDVNLYWRGGRMKKEREQATELGFSKHFPSIPKDEEVFVELGRPVMMRHIVDLFQAAQAFPGVSSHANILAIKVTYDTVLAQSISRSFSVKLATDEKALANGIGREVDNGLSYRGSIGVAPQSTPPLE
jgi:hypothetical protein